MQARGRWRSPQIASEQLVLGLSFEDRSLLTKPFFENDDCALAALKKFRSLKGTKTGCAPMIGKVKCGRRRKSVASTLVEYVGTVLQEGQSSGEQKCSEWGIADLYTCL
ncbi:DUF4817 domain-containing protein [Caerostris darwini]|uniref:DUF4817 domain-containing protein n=1 Tax=Caerostris darwini TaxID=1538125 RepID=A0AAV4WGX4_9ARAC|nr:DUF4817 domain-containing protein [Caerostris darwini]